MNRDGIPHTDRLHLTERVTRSEFNTLKYEVTMEDPVPPAVRGRI